MSQSIFPALAGLAWNLERVPMLETVRQKSISGREIAVRYQAYPL